MLLTSASLNKARQFIQSSGRPLEAARFRFHFDAGDAGEVISELAKFQNKDGGFAGLLEPDSRSPHSSALATTEAFQILREINSHAPGEMAPKATGYFAQTFDPQNKAWRILPPQAGRYPHAPWWDQGSLEENFNHFRFNPTAEVLGYLIEYQAAAPAGLVSTLSETILARLADLKTIEMHDFLCCKRLVETPSIDPGFKARLLEKLEVLLESTGVFNSERWAQYGLRPIQVAGSPASPFYPYLRQAVEANLDYEIGALGEDGSWRVSWTWGGLYPEAWPTAMREWSGVIAVKKLAALKNYGRIEGFPPGSW